MTAKYTRNQTGETTEIAYGYCSNGVNVHATP
jgi:hypothetical protein